MAQRVVSLSPHKDILNAIGHHRVGNRVTKKIARDDIALPYFRAISQSPKATNAQKQAYTKLKRWAQRNRAVQNRASSNFYTNSRSAVKKIAVAGLVLTTAGLARKAYKARKRQVALKPAYRQYDVYPEHDNAVVPAHKYNRPYYDDFSGGRTVKPHLGESVVSILSKNALVEERRYNIRNF